MTLTDTTAPGQTGRVSFVLSLAHAPEKVWRALTDPALLREWLLPVVGPALGPGVAFSFQAPPLPAWDGVVHCRVLAMEAPRLLRYAWVVGEMDTVVTFTLTPTATGTQLSLLQEGFTPAQKQNAAGARYGWRMMGDKLLALLSRDDTPAG